MFGQSRDACTPEHRLLRRWVPSEVALAPSGNGSNEGLFVEMAFC